MDRRFVSAAIAGVAAVATLVAVAWYAAGEQRGLNGGDFRSVVLVSSAVWIASAILNRRSESP